ncbi:MAG: hypothetical protein ACPL3Q_02765, partial [Candidatus Ratteibacteria bacterium]
MNKCLLLCVITLFFHCGYCEKNQPEKIVQEARNLMVDTLKQNNQWQMYQSYTNYVSDILNKTSGTNWWNDKNGYFRLNTIDRWLGNPLDCIVEGEQLSNTIHQQCQSGIKNINQVIQTCAKLLDIKIEINSCLTTKEKNPVDYFNRQLAISEKYVKDAFSNFSEKKLTQFIEITQRLAVREVGDIVAHSLSDRQTGLAMCSMADRIKIEQLITGAIEICEVFENTEFESLKKLKSAKYRKILVGSRKNDTYDIEKLKGISCIIDPDGNDTYIGTLGIQGFGWDIGTAAVVDFSGDDHYIATISGQGFACQGSWAILIDGDGSDVYDSNNPDRVQGIPGPLEYHPRNLIGGNFSFLIDLAGGSDRFSCKGRFDTINNR